ncbi:MAG: hypothetical protein HKN25_02370 [Pyrinomonadaceae bacterium]|nr:hypothetical protein [Pyrinomonadaceae bacterium]
MTKKSNLSLLAVYSLIVLSIAPFQAGGQTGYAKSNNASLVISEKITVEGKRNKGPAHFVPAKNPDRLIQKYRLYNKRIKKEFSQLRNTPEIVKSVPQTNFEEMEKISYNRYSKQKKKKNNNRKVLLIVTAVAIFAGVVVLAATTKVEECDSTACDPLDEDCVCG